MTVTELIKVLSDLPGDALVVLSKDAEDNGFSPLSEATRERYESETAWYGEILHPKESDPDDGVSAVVLWPVN
jgi:hypothetical protein